MADHLRKRIRDRVTTIVTGLTTTGTRVFPSRAYPTEAAELPGLLVYTLSESVEHVSFGEAFAAENQPRRQRRTLQLGIEAVASLAADLDDSLDQICKEVEIALAADLTISGLAHDIRLEGTEIRITGEGQKPIGAARMSWLVDYATREGIPDTLDNG